MHMRDERQYAAVAQDADTPECEDRAAQDICYSAHRADVEDLTAARRPTLRETNAGAGRTPITPGWNQRPGADWPHFDQPRGWISNIRAVVVQAVAPESAVVPLCVVAVAIVCVFRKNGTVVSLIRGHWLG